MTDRFARPWYYRLVVPVALLLLLGPGTARAGVTVSFDAATLNELLPALTMNEFEVPLALGRTLRLQLDDFRVTGFDPAGGPAGTGAILTSLKLRVPQMGLSVPLEPRLLLEVLDTAQGGVLELRFEGLQAQLPMAGTVDLGPLLTPFRYPTDNIWALEGERGDAKVHSRLAGVRMGRSEIQFTFELDVVGAP